MSTVKVQGNASGTGSLTISAPNTNSNQTLTLPDATGTVVVDSAAQILTNKTLGSGTVSGVSLLTLATAMTATGTSVDFTSIPSWVKRITVMFNSVSTNGASNMVIQLGASGGVETTGYVNTIGNTTSASANAGAAYTNGCNVPCYAATSGISGQVVFSNLSGTNWVFSGLVADPTASRIVYTAGVKPLAAALDRIRITTVNGTDTFDVGAINIMWE